VIRLRPAAAGLRRDSSGFAGEEVRDELRKTLGVARPTTMVGRHSVEPIMFAEGESKAKPLGGGS
jgi:hypothetical protein